MSSSAIPPQPSSFRMPLHPVRDYYYSGDIVTPLIRFATWAGCGIRETSQGTQPFPVVRAVVTSELPYSVLPIDVKIDLDIEIREPSEAFQSHPPINWRGVECSFGVVSLWFRNEAFPEHQLTCFDVPMLIPQSAPMAVQQLYLSDEKYILLGTDFFVREQFQTLLRFDQLFRITDPLTGISSLDPTTICGYIERTAQPLID